MRERTFIERHQRAMQSQDILNNQFIRYVKKENYSKARSFLIRGADVHTDNDLAIRISSRHDDMYMIEMLNEFGANLRTHENYAARRAIINGNIEMVKYLHQNGVELDNERDGFLSLSFYCRETEIYSYISNIQLEESLRDMDIALAKYA